MVVKEGDVVSVTKYHAMTIFKGTGANASHILNINTRQ
jgi:hypothetical protein